jgi:cell division protein FtsZ
MPTAGNMVNDLEQAARLRVATVEEFMIEYLGELKELHPRIVVIGVGGAGGNAVANMMGSDVKGVTFVAANTDAQALQANSAPRVLQLGRKTTEGLGAGSRAEVGRAAAEESLAEIDEMLAGAHMCFIAAGLGGGTGTGAAPVIAKAARDKGILTVGVVTKPFAFEGKRRAEVAERGLVELQQNVDTLIVIPNQNLFRIANTGTTFKAAFDLADEVLQQGVRGITDLMVTPGLINLDFADIRTIMVNKGKAMMGTGEAAGDDRAIRAAEAAISNPLLDEAMKGARGLIISVSGGDDLLLMEVDEIAGHIQKLVDPEADIIWGSAFDAALAGRVRVSVVATGIDTAMAAPAFVSAACAAKPAIPALIVPVQAGPPPEMPRPAPETRLDPVDEDELLLTVAQVLVLTPPEHPAPLETVEPFAEPVRGPSLFERMAAIARGAPQGAREELRQAA